MKRFSELNIKALERGFEGEKIKISKVLNREITIHRFKLEDSKVFKKSGDEKCLHLEVSIEEKRHVLFTGSTGLIESIKQVPADCFPFLTTIIEENDRFKFT
jgi:hypothetical protein